MVWCLRCIVTVQYPQIAAKIKNNQSQKNPHFNPKALCTEKKRIWGYYWESNSRVFFFFISTYDF